MALDLSSLGLANGQTNDTGTRADDLLAHIGSLVAQYVQMPDADPTVVAEAGKLGQVIDQAAGGATQPGDQPDGPNTVGAAASATTAQGDSGSMPNTSHPVQDHASGGMARSGATGSNDSFAAARGDARAFLKSKRNSPTSAKA